MKEPDKEEMLPEYDFSDGVRGKQYRAYREGHTVTIHRGDGAAETRHYTPEPGMVELDPDVQAYFPDSESVNQALRRLIQGKKPV